jgi:hypothetical protein
MIFPPNFNPSRGVGINGVVSRWPNRVIPYDISAITSRFLNEDFHCLYIID